MRPEAISPTKKPDWRGYNEALISGQPTEGFGLVDDGYPDGDAYVDTMGCQIIRSMDEVCRYCLNRKATTVDHIFPASRGGRTNRTNLVGCCGRCNTNKKNRTPEEMGWVVHIPPRFANYQEVKKMDRSEELMRKYIAKRLQMLRKEEIDELNAYPRGRKTVLNVIQARVDSYHEMLGLLNAPEEGQ